MYITTSGDIFIIYTPKGKHIQLIWVDIITFKASKVVDELIK